MISARQIVAARSLLGWQQRDLADKSDVAISAVARLEQQKTDPRRSTLTKLQNALERGDHSGRIEFISPEGGKGEGVRLLSPLSEEERAAGESGPDVAGPR